MELVQATLASPHKSLVKDSVKGCKQLSEKQIPLPVPTISRQSLRSHGTQGPPVLKSFKHRDQDGALLKHLWGHTVPVTAESHNLRSILYPNCCPCTSSSGVQRSWGQGWNGTRPGWPQALCTQTPEY